MSSDPERRGRGAGGGGGRWSLTGESLDRLLDLLGPDRETAGGEYRRVYARLVRIFEWRGCRHPDELADETMNRVAARLAAGLAIESPDPLRYFCGVAYRVFKEVLRDEQRERRALAEVRHLPPAGAGEDDGARLGCLERCLGELAETQRDLVLRYHTGDGRQRIGNRRALAGELGVEPNALRIRVHRLRTRLEGCVTACVREMS